MRYRQILVIVPGMVAIFALACSSGSSTPQSTGDSSASGQQSSATPSVQPAAPSVTRTEPALEPEPTPAPPSTSAYQVEPTPTAVPAPEPTPAQATADDLPSFMKFGWKTDFSKHSVPLAEIMPGGPPRDGIPPIDRPKFIDVANLPDYMKDDEPVVSVEINGEAKAYPLAILVSHEIVNDDLGGIPITVTYCPLCNTAIVFDRRVDGRLLDFGTSGNLRNSDLVMWDRQTESWWQQITGEAIVGELTGARLEFIPAPVTSWRDFRTAFPHGQVLSRETGFGHLRNYDIPPYAGYDSPNNVPFLFFGDTDSRLKPMERVVSLKVGDEAVAYPFAVLRDHPVVNDSVNGKDIVIFYAGGTLSPFAGSGFSGNRTVGSTAVYDPVVDDQKLTFRVRGDVIVDDETETIWNMLGQAVAGPLKGAQLTPVVHSNHFWFAWFAFNPDTAIRSSEDVSGQGKNISY